MGEIENFIERENKFKRFCYYVGGLTLLLMVGSAGFHDNTGELIYLFAMVSFGVTSTGFFILGYLVQVQNKIIGLLGFIIQGIQEEEKLDTAGMVKKIVPQFKKILEKELK